MKQDGTGGGVRVKPKGGGDLSNKTYFINKKYMPKIAAPVASFHRSRSRPPVNIKQGGTE